MEKDTQRKKHKRLMIAFYVLIGVAAALCLTVFFIWLHGRNSMNKPSDSPNLPDEQNQIVTYKGKQYRYNAGMRSILLLGIDADRKPSAPYEAQNQSDLIVIAALDTAHNKMTLISLNRDTMCDMEILDGNGSSQGVANAQLALAFSYGDGLHRSCQLTRDAVSNLFYGLPIQGYAAYYLGGIADLNDAVGGVTVTVLDDYPFSHISSCWNMYPGEEVTLTGEQARLYTQARLEDRVDANQLRMARQKQYMLSLIAQVKQSIRDNPTKVLSLYDTLDDYLLSDLDLGAISYLATQAASMAFSGEIRTIEGSSALGAGNHAEFTTDNASLYELMLDVFYEEVTSTEAS